MRTIFLSVGHGEKKWYGVQDKGASWNGITEFDFITPVIDKLMQLDHPGLEFVRVPAGSLQSKINFINKKSKDGDVALEFHMDSSMTANGCSTWFMGGSDYAYKKGIAFQMQYCRITGIPGRGVKSDLTNRLGRLGFVRDTKPLALLVEMGFLQNIDDRCNVEETGHIGILKGIYGLINS